MRRLRVSCVYACVCHGAVGEPGVPDAVHGLRYRCNAFWAWHLEALAIDCAGFEIDTLMEIRTAKAGLMIQWRTLKMITRERPAVPGEAMNTIREGT